MPSKKEIEKRKRTQGKGKTTTQKESNKKFEKKEGIEKNWKEKISIKLIFYIMKNIT
jgi:hypothetical protein